MERIIKRTKFFRLSFHKDDESVEKLFGIIKGAEERYRKIFGIIPDDFLIFVVYSREEFNKHAGFKTDDWVDGHFRGKLIIFSPSVREKYVKMNSSRHYKYKSFFDHEINHLFYISLVGSYNPVWLHEGYATYMMGSWKPSKTIRELGKIKSPEKLLFYRYIVKKYYAHAHEFYSLSYYLVRYLIETHTHDDMMLLMRRFSKTPKNSNFEKIFKEIYKMTVKEAISKAISC